MMKIGVIGLGDIAQKAYLPVLAGMPEVECHLFTRNQRTLQEVSRKYRMPHCHESLESLVKSGVKAAFVHAATSAHYSIVKELLSNGIHVYIDKPITDHYKQARELTELAKRRGLILVTGFNRRFAPLYQELKKIEQPNFIVMQKNRVSLPGEIRTFLFDDFIHVIDTVRFLLPNRIEEMDVQAKMEGGLLYHVIVRFAGHGWTAVCIMNRDSGINEEVLEVMSTSEKCVVRNLSQLTRYKNSTETHVHFKDWDRTLHKRGFEMIVADFLEAVQQQKQPSIEMEDALLTHELCEQIAVKLSMLS